jgi:hypothetical protein
MLKTIATTRYKKDKIRDLYYAKCISQHAYNTMMDMEKDDSYWIGDTRVICTGKNGCYIEIVSKVTITL